MVTELWKHRVVKQCEDKISELEKNIIQYKNFIDSKNKPSLKDFAYANNKWGYYESNKVEIILLKEHIWDIKNGRFTSKMYYEWENRDFSAVKLMTKVLLKS